MIDGNVAGVTIVPLLCPDVVAVAFCFLSTEAAEVWLESIPA